MKVFKSLLLCFLFCLWARTSLHSQTTYGRNLSFELGSFTNWVGYTWRFSNEWKQLEMYLGMSQAEDDREKWRGTNEGGKLKYEGIQNWRWTSPNTGATNGSGFSALPGGWRDGAGYFKNLGTAVRFWSSSKKADYALVRELDYNSSGIFRDTKGLYEAHSVRCIKDK